jgi:hypothetical protein
MIRSLSLAVLVALAGCAEKSGPSTPPAAAPSPAPAPAPAPAPLPPPPPPPPPAPPAPPEPEPSRITVQHILIAFVGAASAPETVTRTKEEARTFAQELLERVRKGEDVAKLAQQFSTDPGGGRYSLVNNGVAKVKASDIPRKQFIRPFTDVAFSLKVGEAGLVEYDPREAAYGWHVIKRLE